MFSSRVTGKWRTILVAAIVAVAFLAHAPLLGGLAGLLIVDQPSDDFDAVCVSAWGNAPDGDRAFDVAGELCGPTSKYSRRVLIVEPPPSRLEEVGAIDSFASVARRELAKQGIRGEAISVVRGEPCDYRCTARALAGPLRDRPGAAVVLLCDRFRSAEMRAALDAALDPAESARVRIRALPDRQYDETNWWTRRCGYRAFGFGWLMRFQGWLCGGDNAPRPPDETADDYEGDFLHDLGERTP